MNQGWDNPGIVMDRKYWTEKQMANKKGFCPFRRRIKGTQIIICKLSKSLCCYWCSDNKICDSKQCSRDGQLTTVNCRD